MSPFDLFGMGTSASRHASYQRRQRKRRERDRSEQTRAAKEELQAMVHGDPGLPLRMLLDPNRRHEKTPTGSTWAAYAVATDENAALVVTFRPDLHRETINPDGSGLTLLALAVTSHSKVAAQVAEEDPALLHQTIHLSPGERALKGFRDKERGGPDPDAAVDRNGSAPPTILEHQAARSALASFKARPDLLREKDSRGDPLAFRMIRSTHSGAEGSRFLEHLLPLDPELIHLEDCEGRKLWEDLFGADFRKTSAHIIHNEALWARTGRRGRPALEMALERLVQADPHAVSSLSPLGSSPFESIAPESLDQALGSPMGEDDPRTMLTTLAEEHPAALFDRLRGGDLPAHCHPRFFEPDPTGRTALDRILHDETCQQRILGSRDARQLSFGGKRFVDHLAEASGAPLSVRARARVQNTIDRMRGSQEEPQTLDAPSDPEQESRRTRQQV